MDPNLKIKMVFRGRDPEKNILTWMATTDRTPLGTYGHLIYQVDALYFYSQMWGKKV